MIRRWLVRLNEVSRGCQWRPRGRRTWGPEQLEDRLLLSGNPTAYTVNLLGDPDMGTGTTGDIAYVINKANGNASPAGSVIAFDPTLFATPQKIRLTRTLELREQSSRRSIDGRDGDGPGGVASTGRKNRRLRGGHQGDRHAL